MRALALVAARRLQLLELPSQPLGPHDVRDGVHHVHRRHEAAGVVVVAEVG